MLVALQAGAGRLSVTVLARVEARGRRIPLRTEGPTH